MKKIDIIRELSRKKAKRIYISGGITGIDNYQQKFDEMETFLKEHGYKNVINPVKVNLISDSFNWREFMVIDIALLSICDTIIMLKDWQNSQGCRTEYTFAKTNNYNIVEVK